MQREPSAQSAVQGHTRRSEWKCTGCEAPSVVTVSDDAGSAGARIGCAACSAGYGRAEGNDNTASCMQCSEYNTYSTVGICQACPAGQKPRDDRTGCTSCENGYAGNDGSCSQCESGTTPDDAQVSCVACGTGRAGVSGLCDVTCEAGQRPADDRTACTACDTGQYSPSGATCVPCSADGLHTPDAKTCTICSDGTEPNDDRTACVLCPTGTAGTDGLCGLCAAGKQPRIDAETRAEISDRCVSCGETEAMEQPGVTLFNETKGWYSMDGVACSQCEPGTAPNTLHSTCDVCPPGKISDVGLVCDFCPEGEEANVITLGVGATHCIACLDGLHRHNDETGGALDMESCDTCTAGQQPNDDLSGCTPCQAGRYSSDGGTCIDCIAGKEPNTAQTDCVDCAVGEVSAGDQCAACSPGTAPESTKSQCVECATGRYSELGETCLQCELPRVVNGQRTACLKCEAGSGPLALTSDGATAYACAKCVGTMYSTAGQCQDCAAPNIVDDAHQTCTACVAGTSPDTNRTSCVACDGATYSAFGVACTVCEAPSVVTVSDGAKIACSSCPAGQGPSEDGGSCVSCTGTTYSTVGVCQDCAAPNIVDDAHQTCTACVAGQEPNVDRTACVDCVGATYSAFGVECTVCEAPSVVSVSVGGARIGCGSCPAGQGPSEDGGSCVSCTGTTYSTVWAVSGLCRTEYRRRRVSDMHGVCCGPGAECSEDRVHSLRCRDILGVRSGVYRV